MKEAQLRKWHRGIGISLALFLSIQASTGVLLNLDALPLSMGFAHVEDKGHSQVGLTLQDGAELVESLHHGGGSWGALYRLALGVAATWMAVSGSWIFLKIRFRSKAKRGASRDP